jgi:hypothetical protein
MEPNEVVIDHKYKGKCTCGWAGKKQDTWDDANKEASSHWKDVHGSKATTSVDLIKIPLPLDGCHQKV